MTSKPLRVSVYFDDDDEKRAAESLLEGREMSVYEDVLDAWIEEEDKKKLSDAGFLVTPCLETQETEAAMAMPAAAGSVGADEDSAPESEPVFMAMSVEPPVAASPPTATDESFHVYELTLSQPLTPDIRADFERLGLEIRSFEPPNRYQFALTTKEYADASELPYVESIAEYAPRRKWTEALQKHVEEDGFRSAGMLSDIAGPSEPQIFDILLHRVRDLGDVRKVVEAANNTEIIAAEGRYIRYRGPVDTELIDDLTHLPHVRSVTPYEAPKLFQGVGATPAGAPAGQDDDQSIREMLGLTVHAELDQWTGEGETVAVIDSGIDKAHPAFAGRIAHSEAVQGADEDDKAGHGTHVAGIIAGAENGKPQGGAPKANLVSIGILRHHDRRLALELFPDLGDLLKLGLDRGAKIINLSWGTPLAGSYDAGSLAIDRFVLKNPDVLVVVAAGNSGAAPQGFPAFGSVGVPATAKNVLTVGASGRRPRPAFTRTYGQWAGDRFPLPPASAALVVGTLNSTAYLSSRGPTDYDSVKPDVLAPGTFILAPQRAGGIDPGLTPEPWTDPGYAYLCGTSMATPIVSAAAAVLRHYLRVKHGVDNPSAALLKAILIASARKITPLQYPPPFHQIGYPDFDQGFGRVDLSSVLQHGDAPDRRLFTVDVRTDTPDALESRVKPDSPRRSSHIYTLTVSPGAKELRIVLAWTDWPAVYIQNNLELTLRTPDLQNLLGNSEFTAYRSVNFGGGVEQFDKRNNVETILLKDPPPGDYRIKILAENTVQSPQGYAFCVVGECSKLERTK